MHLAFIDESGDSKFVKDGTRSFVLSALIIPDNSFKQVFEEIKNFRHSLKISDGILMNKEFHATEFVRGKGKLGPNTVGKYRRSQIFNDFLKLLNDLSSLGVYTINCAIENEPGLDSCELAVERLLNRLNRTFQHYNTYGILIFDEGKDKLIRNISRRMHVHNYIPSMFGEWENGSHTRNITLDFIVGDPFFKCSGDDYFLQAVDFIAYSLLKQEVPPTPLINKYGLNNSFNLLQDIWYKKARLRDPQGVVRK